MHCHLIPGVDDGSKSLEETIECLQTLHDVGYQKVYITPHFQFPRFPNQEADIQRRFADLKQALQEHNIQIELAGLGGEYRIDDGFSKRLNDSRFLKINDKYVLLELSLHQSRMGIDETIFDLQMKGYDVILAHPERYPYYNAHSQTLAHLHEQGVLFQLNVLSLSGFYGESAQHKAFDYLEKKWVDFLGTDTHNVMYAKALIDASNNHKVLKVLETYNFLNKEL